MKGLPLQEVGASRDEAARPPVLNVSDLTMHFPGGRNTRPVRAVDGVSLTIAAGETVGLVGESGCGKTTVGRVIVRLLEPTSGRIEFDGLDITRLPRRQLRDVRRDMQLVFQDPFASLNPRLSVHEILAEPLRIHALYRNGGSRRVAELLDVVGLPRDAADRRPSEFSGGQRQRICIARALALRPRLLILDEPVSSVDVSIQAQLINLLRDLQDEFGLSYLFIAHDLAVVRHISDRVAVMYLGRIIETGEAKDVFERPAHPYTRALLSAVPLVDPERAGRRDRIVLQGDLPSAADPPSGCRFRTRCWKADDRCATVEPRLSVPEGQRHPSACHYPEQPAAVPAGSSVRDAGEDSGTWSTPLDPEAITLTPAQPGPTASPRRMGALAPPRQHVRRFARAAASLWAVVRRHPAGAAGACILLLLTAAAVAAPLVAPHPPFVVDLSERLRAPDGVYLLGSDHLGRDVLSRLVYGARVSLIAGFGAASLAASVGVPLGLLAAYFGRWPSAAMMRLMDFLLALPAIVLALTIVAILGDRGLAQVVLAVAIVSVPIFVRIMRAATLVIRRQEFVEASDALGAGDGRILFRVILPNAIGPLVAVYTITVASAVLIEGGLSFLGLGLSPPTPSWGLMLSEGRSHLAEAPWYGLTPGIALAVTVLALDTVSRAVQAASGSQAVESVKKVG